MGAGKWKHASMFWERAWQIIVPVVLGHHAPGFLGLASMQPASIAEMVGYCGVWCQAHFTPRPNLSAFLHAGQDALIGLLSLDGLACHFSRFLCYQSHHFHLLGAFPSEM